MSTIGTSLTVATVIFAVICFSSLNFAWADDNHNINRLLNNQVIVSRQIMCVLEKSPCDQLGRQLKGNLLLVFQQCVAFDILHDLVINKTTTIIVFWWHE